MKNFINVTNHSIRLLKCSELGKTCIGYHCNDCVDSQIVTLPPSNIIAMATPVSEVISKEDGIEFVTTQFKPNPVSEKLITELKNMNPDSILIGSIIAAQAFPGTVVSPVPVPGFERVPRPQRLVRSDRFNIFENKEVLAND